MSYVFFAVLTDQTSLSTINYNDYLSFRTVAVTSPHHLILSSSSQYGAKSLYVNFGEQFGFVHVLTTSGMCYFPPFCILNLKTALSNIQSRVTNASECVGFAALIPWIIYAFKTFLLDFESSKLVEDRRCSILYVSQIILPNKILSFFTTASFTGHLKSHRTTAKLAATTAYAFHSLFP